MKKSLPFFAAVLFMFLCTDAHATLFARTAGGAWATAGTWSTTSSAGVSSGTIPTATDDVVFDSGSTTAVTLDSATADVCKTLTMQSASNKLTFTAADKCIVSGNVTFFTGQGANVSGTGTLSMIVTGTLTTAGVTLPGAISFGGTSQTYTLADALTATGNMTCAGTTLITIATGGNNISVAAISVTTSTTFTGTGTVAGTTFSLTTATLTIASNWTMSSTFTVASSPTISGAFTFQAASWSPGGGLTLTSTSLVLTGAVTLASATTMVGSGTVQAASFSGGAFTLTITSDWTITGTATETGSSVINGSGKNFKIGGGLTQSTFGLSGTATVVLNGTGTWSGGTLAVTSPLTVNTAGTITVSGTVLYDTGTFTFTAGTITGGTINFDTTTTLNTNAGGKIASTIKIGGSSTYTLSSKLTGTIINILAVSPTFSGAFDITCDTLTVGVTTASKTIKFVKSQILTVTTNLNLDAINSSGFTTTIQSDTASTSMTFTYQGTLANEKIFNVIFTDVDASTSTNHIYNYCGGTLTRTTNIYNTDASSFPVISNVLSGVSYAGGALTGTAASSGGGSYTFSS